MHYEREGERPSHASRVAHTSASAALRAASAAPAALPARGAAPTTVNSVFAAEIASHEGCEKAPGGQTHCAIVSIVHEAWKET